MSPRAFGKREERLLMRSKVGCRKREDLWGQGFIHRMN